MVTVVLDLEEGTSVPDAARIAQPAGKRRRGVRRVCLMIKRNRPDRGRRRTWRGLRDRTATGWSGWWCIESTTCL